MLRKIVGLSEPINKFKHLYQAKKPTGDPTIKDIIQDAKAAFQEMHNCGKTYENVDDDMNEDDKEYESDDERNGVGADVLNEGWSESQLPQDQQLQSDGAAESGWSVTPTQGYMTTYQICLTWEQWIHRGKQAKQI
ncbi:hypothetical protein PSHT_00814 [Puccinia striiformis]|uniref:Uncharacterized protein n=1 Tax=Puccinia striiformis TaxID=27350 RepID=A0A2S4WM34_9BASI|nr:hypothetical protein PSHT_00814 [Puccinia striiformis]